ncbi:hypothetical protein [Lactobacillus delbrueckii]|nr:hypothetical protein [Lactobacillus delbrueckii]
MFGKKKKAEAAKAEQEASKKTDGRILLYSDIGENAKRRAGGPAGS